MNRSGIYLLIFFFGFGVSSYAQRIYRQMPKHPFEQEIPKIKSGLKMGDTKALGQLLLNYTSSHDTIIDFLGHHYHRNTVSGVAWRTFSEYYLFGSEEQKTLFDTNKTAFRNMILPEFDNIRFSEIGQFFFLVPPEERAVEFRVTTLNASKNDKPGDIIRVYREDMKTSLKYGHIQDAIDKLNDIARLNSPEAEAFIKSCFTPDFFKTYAFPFKPSVYEAAASGLSHYPTLPNVRFILKLQEERIITETQAISALEQITNIPFNDITFEKNRYQQVVTYLEHYKTLGDMRRNGYEKRFHVSSRGFESETDYYGNMLIMADQYEDRAGYMNALYDLRLSKDPASLKFLAGMFYRHRTKWNDYHFYNEYDPSPAEMIEKLTGLQLLVKNESHKFTTEYKYGVARLNYFLYWNNHYRDYVWNDSLNRFINTKTQVEKPDAVADYYQQLGSQIDSVAAHAFLMLTESDPEKVKELIRTSPEIIEEAKSKHYTELPMFPDRRLKALVDLTAYCKKHGIIYKPGKDLEKRLNSLDEKTTDAEQYKLEESLIASLTLDELTALEYWAASGGERATYSIGRMLDRLYTKYIDGISTDDEQLRLFLKKASLFNRFGIIGVCNKYLWKLSKRPESFKDRLQTLLDKETDPDIKAAITGLLQNNYWKSDCKGDVPALYDEPVNELETLRTINAMSSDKQGTEYANLQYNVYFTDRVASGMMSQSQLKPMIAGLKKYAEANKENDFDFNRSMAFSYWLKHQHLPYHTQFEEALALKNKEAYADLTKMIILQGKYIDIPVLLNQYESENKNMSKWMIQSHLSEDLALPVSLSSKPELDTLRSRHSRLSEKELYKAYLIDFGLGTIFKSNDSLDYEKLYNMLEYGVVDAFVGGGGGRESTSAALAVQVLELHFKTLLGFHWRKEYLYAGTVHSFYTRSCAWMKFMRDKKLVTVPEHRAPSFSN